MRVNPDAPFVALFLADRLKDAGRMGQALELARQSLARDPYVPAKIALTLRMLEATGQQDEAERMYRQAQHWWPYDSDIFWDRASGIIDRGDVEALVRFEDEVGRDNQPRGYVPMGALAAAVKAGDVAAAQRTCPRSQQLSFRSDVCMLVLARLGDNDDAFALAERLFPDRVGRTPADEERIWLDSPWVPDTDFLTGPVGAPMRRDPRFLELARRLGLLAYWRSGRTPDFCKTAPEPICSELRPR
jgi:tetratricopeptide (TPR) repeat protein